MEPLPTRSAIHRVLPAVAARLSLNLGPIGGQPSIKPATDAEPTRTDTATDLNHGLVLCTMRARLCSSASAHRRREPRRSSHSSTVHTSSHVGVRYADVKVTRTESTTEGVLWGRRG